MSDMTQGADMSEGKRLSDEYAALVKQLRIEADASEELHPGDSYIETMRQAADAIERLSAKAGKMTEERAREILAQCNNGAPIFKKNTGEVWVLKSVAIAAILQASTEAPPARMDVEVMREAAAKVCDAEAESYGVHGSVRKCATQIRALPLPVSEASVATKRPLEDGSAKRDAVIEAAWALVNETPYLTLEECAANGVTPGTGNKLKSALLLLEGDGE
jgi:hypothetical protein